MTKKEIHVGHTYVVKVSTRKVLVEVLERLPDGWLCRSLETGRPLRVERATKFRYEADEKLFAHEKELRRSALHPNDAVPAIIIERIKEEPTMWGLPEIVTKNEQAAAQAEARRKKEEELLRRLAAPSTEPNRGNETN